MATLDEIAKRLNLSKSSVSKALNGRSDVSQETRDRVLSFVKEIEYEVVTRSQKKLCIYIDNIKYESEEDFGYDIINEFKKFAYSYGFSVNILEVGNDYNFEDYENEMQEKNYQGCFVLGLNFKDSMLEKIKNTRFPTILLDNVVRSDKIAYVGSDNGEGILQAVKYLKNLGHTRIAFYNGTSETFVAVQRSYAFRNALLRLGLPCEKELMVEGDFFSDTSDKLMPLLLLHSPTAILCASDNIAATVLDYLKRNGVRIPDDISVMGFDNLPICQHTEPALTTVEQNRKGIGATAFMGLNCLISGIPMSSILTKTRIIKRESVSKNPK